MDGLDILLRGREKTPWTSHAVPGYTYAIDQSTTAGDPTASLVVIHVFMILKNLKYILLKINISFLSFPGLVLLDYSNVTVQMLKH